MKNIRGATHISVFFLLCWGLNLGIKKIYAAPLPKKISLHLDSHFSKAFKDKVTMCALEHQKVSLSAQYLSELLQTTFPVLESVTLKNYLSGNANILVKGAYPVALVNSDLVLASNNAVMHRDIYPEALYKDLPLFHVVLTAQDKERLYLSDACKKFIKTFDRSLLQEYEVQWINETLIKLHDRNNQKLTLLVDSQTIIEDSIKTAYARIREKKLHQSIQPKRGRGWVVDARFRNQMIVFLRGEHA